MSSNGVLQSDPMSYFELKPWNRGITDEELLDDLRRVANLLGKRSVQYAEYREHGRCSSGVFETRFGSWNESLRAAGLEIARRQDISDQELFENMERVWTSLGRQPRRQEMTKPISAFSKGTYERRFGGWRQALEKFVAFVNGGSSMEPSITAATAASISSPRFPDLRMRWRVLTRDSFRCRSCGTSPAIVSGVVLHVDHIIPWSKGGRTEKENLQTLCEPCNLGKSDA